MDKPVLGKVARVINSRHLAINVGTKDGVVLGMKFQIFDPGDDHGSLTIHDPDTDEVIGAVRLAPKITVTVVEVQDKLSVAETQHRRINVGGIGILGAMGSFSRALMPPQWITKYETLKRIDSSPEPLDYSESIVKEGDLVIQVVEVEATPEAQPEAVE